MTKKWETLVKIGTITWRENAIFKKKKNDYFVNNIPDFKQGRIFVLLL